MAIELALTQDGRWAADLDALVDATAAAGFDAVGVFLRDVTPGAHAALAAAGLRCHDVLALVITEDEEKVLRRAASLAEAAASVQADWVLTTFHARLDDRSGPLVARCAAMFHDAGARLAAEFSPLGPVGTLDAALDVVTAAGPERAGVLIDTWHFFRGESTWDQLAQVPLDRIAYVQFTDALPPASTDLMAETMDRRTLPGEGELDLTRFAGVLRDRGWEGVVSVEVLNADLCTRPVGDVARALHDATAPYWR